MGGACNEPHFGKPVDLKLTSEQGFGRLSLCERPMFGRFKRARQETAIREALTAEFGKQGLDFASFDLTIQRTMVMGALASGSVQKQVEGFTRVAAKIAEHFGERLEKKTGSP
jgi:hypothetical protein